MLYEQVAESTVFRMSTFYYSVYGTNDDRPNIGTVEAEDKQAAIVKLDGVYGNTDDKKLVDINMLTESEFNSLQAERDAGLTHRVE